MTPPISPPTAAASGTEHPPEGPGTTGTGADAVEALARILDPEAFEPPVGPRGVGLELYRHDRRKVAVLSAARAVAAGYRLVSELATMTLTQTNEAIRLLCDQRARLEGEEGS